LQQLNGGTAYNVPGVYIVHGTLQASKVEDAIRAVIARHEVLRTRFELREGEVVQRIEETVAFDVEYREEAEANPRALMRTFVRPFDLSQAPLLRVLVVKRGEEKYVLCADMHHIVSDMVSSGLLIRDFAQAYQGGELTKLPLQYKDYAVWQQARLRGDYGRRLEAYWLKLFGGEIPLLALHTDKPRTSEQSFEGRRQSRLMDTKLSEEVTDFCTRQGVTRFMLLLAAYFVLLSKYSEQEDIVVGTSVVGRDHPDLEEVMGMFVNALALRSAPRSEKRFSDYLQEVKAQVLEGFEHQNYPFEELVEKAGAVRDAGRNPLFSVLFVMTAAENDGAELQGLEIMAQEFDFNIARFDLTLRVHEVGGRIGITLEYKTQLFSPETIEILGTHYERVISEAVRSPGQLIREIELVSHEERALLLEQT